MTSDLAAPAATGLGIGILFILLLAFIFTSASVLSDAQLVAKSKQLRDVQHFLSKYPDAKVDVYRDLQKVTIGYMVSKQLSEPTIAYPDGITRKRVLGITYTNSALDGTANLSLYCIGIPEILATPAFGREGDMIGRIDNEGCFGSG